MVWVRGKDGHRLYSILKGRIAQVTPCGGGYRSTVWHPRGQSSLTLESSRDAKSWAEQTYRRVVHGDDS
jgi:hypothetical protein